MTENLNAQAPETQVDKAISTLGETITTANALVADLIMRLEHQVLMPAKENTEKAVGQPAPTRCKLATAIEQECYRIADINNRIESVLQRLEV